MAKPLLLVDVGNSRVKWAWAGEDGGFRAGPAFPSAAMGLEAGLDRHWGSLDAPAAVYASNVAGAEAAERIIAWVAHRWHSPVYFVRSEAQGYGVVNGYEQPECLGVDRWVGLIALRHGYALPACLVDCGTALTLDLLDEDGRHLGGLIAPGPALMKRALFQETWGVRPEGAARAGLLGRDTAACVDGGVMRACAGLVEKTLGEPVLSSLSRPPTLVLSGGDGEILGQSLGLPYRLAPDLVLLGLLIIATTEPT